MLVAVRYLNDHSRGGINQIEDWHLPAGAFKTKFTAAAGRVLYLVGTPEQIRKQDAVLDRKDAVLNYQGHEFKFDWNPNKPEVKKAAPVVSPKVVVAANVEISANLS